MKHVVAMLTLVLSSAVTVLAEAPATQAYEAQVGLSLAKAQSLIASSIMATGRVQALTSARIGPRVSGRLAEFGKSPEGKPLDVGMRVHKGDVLFQLEQTTFKANAAVAGAQLESARAMLADLVAPERPEKLEQLKQDVEQIKARVADRTRERDRYKRLVEEEKTLPLRRLEEVEVDLVALTAQLKSAEARLAESQHGPTPTEVAVASARVKEAEAAAQIAQNDLKDSTVTAPFDGVVTKRMKGVGDYCVNMPPTDVIELVNLDEMEAELAVPESYLRSVLAGKTKLTLRSPLLGRPVALPVTRVVEQVDVAKGTFAVRVAVPADQRGSLVPGSFVTCDLPLVEGSGGVIAPARAITTVNGKPSLFVARDGRMVRQAVELGDKLSEGIIVTAGLKDGDKIVLGPPEQLSDGKELPEHLKVND